MNSEQSELEMQLSSAEKELAETDARINQLETEIALFDPTTLPKNKARFMAYRFIWALSLPFLITAIILIFTQGISYYLTWVFWGIGMVLLLVVGSIVCPRDFLKTCRKMNVNSSVFSSVYKKVQNAIDERHTELDSLKQKREELSLKVHEYQVRITLI